jgi:hypothetical protein
MKENLLCGLLGLAGIFGALYLIFHFAIQTT